MLSRNKTNYSAVVQSRYLRPLIKLEIVRKNGELYDLNLKGIFEYLLKKNPQYQFFKILKFYEGEKSDFVKDLFRFHIKKISEEMRLSSPNNSADFSEVWDFYEGGFFQAWDFFDVFQSFIYFYGRKSPDEVSSILKDFNGKERFKDEFRAECYGAWLGSIDYRHAKAAKEISKASADN